MIIGLAKLWTALREQSDGLASWRADRAGSSKVLAGARVTIATGGDNLGTYTPLFATSTPDHSVPTVAVFTAMTAF